MEYTKKQKLTIIKTLENYSKFTEFGKEEKLSTTYVNIYKDDLLYNLINEFCFFKVNQYYERADAIERLTVHLITDTALPVSYINKDGLSLFDQAIMIKSTPLQEALQSRFDIENEKNINTVFVKFKQYTKQHKKK